MAEVQNERAFLSSLIESMVDEVWFTDPQGNFTLVNPAGIREFGLAPGRPVAVESLAKNLEILRADGSPRPLEEAPPLRALSGEVVRNQEEIVRTPASSELRHRLVNSSLVKDSLGRIIGAVSVVRDITERKRAENALHRSEIQLQSTLEATADGILAVDRNGKVFKSNRRFAELWRIPRPLIEAGDDQALLDFVADQLADPDTFMRKVRALYGTDAVDMDELAFKDGRIFERYSFPMIMDGAIIGRVWSFRDVTALKKAKEALRASEARYRLLVENAQEAVLVNQNGVHKFVNRAAVEMTGFSMPELLSRPFSDFIHPDDRMMVMENYRKRMAGEAAPARYVFRLLTRDGGVKWVETGSALIDWEGGPATLNFLTDITARHDAEEALQASLREKEVMLREIHHRVKNNMQVMSSLLNLQAGRIKDENARKMLKEGQFRIRSMALVHEKLYRSQNLAKVDFANYVQSLLIHLFHFFEFQDDRIRLETDLASVDLDISLAVPCGLILNELISNSLKHAFPDGRKGLIRVGLKRGNDDRIVLRVADDGVGFPEALDFRRAESLGLQIVDLLVDQLEGTIELDGREGTAFTIVFRELESKAGT